MKTLVVSNPHSKSKGPSELGFSLIEVLAAMLIISVISIGVHTSTVGALYTAKKTEINHAATSLVISKVEELSAIETKDLTAADGGTESNVAWPAYTNLDFTRVTTIVVNADQSRTVTVSVSSNSTYIPTTVEFTTTFAVWE